MGKYCKLPSCGKALEQRKNELTIAYSKRDTCNSRCADLLNKIKKDKLKKNLTTVTKSQRIIR